jgi:hypothetical protein
MTRIVLPRVAALLGMVAVVGLMMLWIALSPRLWQVWVFPLVSFVVLQVIALKSPHRATFFKLADYVHYGLIGSAVGVASLYVLNGGLVDRLSLLIERHVLTQERAGIDATTPALNASLSETRAASKSQTEAAGQCGPDADYARYLNEAIGSQGKTISYAPASTRRCYDAYRTRLKLASLESELQQSINRRAAVEVRLKALDQELLPVNSATGDGATLSELQVRFLMIPTLILLGVSIKLGKTTHSLLV